LVNIISKASGLGKLWPTTCFCVSHEQYTMVKKNQTVVWQVKITWNSRFTGHKNKVVLTCSHTWLLAYYLWLYSDYGSRVQ
jgi:hypothetical protein